MIAAVQATKLLNKSIGARGVKQYHATPAYLKALAHVRKMKQKKPRRSPSTPCLWSSQLMSNKTTIKTK